MMQGLEGYWSKKVVGLTTLSRRLCFILLCSALLFYCTHAQLCNLWLNLCVGVSLNVFDCTCKMFYTVRCALVVELTVVLILLPLLSSLFINYGDSPGSVSDTWGRQEMCYIFFYLLPCPVCVWPLITNRDIMCVFFFSPYLKSHFTLH